MNKSGKIFAAVLAVAIIFSVGGFAAGLRTNKQDAEETRAVSQISEQEKTAADTTDDTAVTAGTETDETAETAERTRETATQNTTKAANTNGYYYNYPGVNPAPAEINSDKWYLLLVNIHYYLPKNYPIDLVTVIKGNEQTLDAKVAPHYIEMYNAAKAVGYTLTPNSGYRSISYQAILFESLFQEYQGDKQTVVLAASKRRQPPGCSEHNAGLAMDLCQISSEFANTLTFKWLSDNASNYGFILRYPEDKQTITGVKFEPWHWRYVGIETAQAMKASGRCLEEYLNKINP